MDAESNDNIVDVPLDGTLDLHTFLPQEITGLVIDYLSTCREQNILQVRIIHGKGIGTLRETVHAVLASIPCVDTFRFADETAGGWGATIVTLRPQQ